MPGEENQEASASPAQFSKRKSAGTAFVLSFFLPGAGQIYCGKTGRGQITLGFWVVSVLCCFAKANSPLRSAGILGVVVLWIFAFLDSYFTAIEINFGDDAQVDVTNPRVAVVLNLLTAGLGYFYLGERTKGLAIFVGTQIVRLGIPHLTGYAGGVVSLAVIALQAVLAFDAYRIADAQLTEALGHSRERPESVIRQVSRLPKWVPITVACCLVAIFIAAIILGLVLRAAGRPLRDSAARRARASVQAQQTTQLPSGPPTDLPSAVTDVQTIQHKSGRTREDLPRLDDDVRVISHILHDEKLNPDDAAVAHYYRGEAVLLENSIRENDDDPVDATAARQALRDFDAVIAANPHTYVREVQSTDAEYNAGLVARVDLKSGPLAYKYWNQCAQQNHAGCMNIVADSYLTGDGGQRPDINAALDMHATVFNSGTRFHCAGADSALTIAEIEHFTGARKDGTDELEWVARANNLLDQLSNRDNNKNVCDRAQTEIEEFLLRLSRNEQRPEILEDASHREDDFSPLQSVIQFLSGQIDKDQLDSIVRRTPSKFDRCTAYFDAFWFARIEQQDAPAGLYYRRMREIGGLHCSMQLFYAGKFK